MKHTQAIDQIVIYPSYLTNQGGYIEGRIIKRRQFKEYAFEDGWRKNLVRSLAHLVNRERKSTPFTLTFDAFEYAGITDQEGYFKVAIPAGQYTAGWQNVSVSNAFTQTLGQCLVINTQIPTGIITDLDDTILVSEVTKKLRLISNTFFKNPLQREAVEGAAKIYHHWASAHPHTPIFYLSATPRQLYTFVEGFLKHYGFPRGLITTRRLTRDQAGDSFHVKTYKIEKISAIFTALPQIRFRLIGDDGEHDPDIYHEISQRFPHQVEGIWIRKIRFSALKYPQHQDLQILIESINNQNERPAQADL